MSTGYKPPQVTLSGLIDGHPTSLAHGPEQVQDLIYQHTCRSNGFVNEDEGAY
jgi:hypothetical protein